MPKYKELAGAMTRPKAVDRSKPEMDLGSAKIMLSLAEQVESKYESAATPSFGGDIVVPAHRLEMGQDPKMSAPGSYEYAQANGKQADSTRPTLPSYGQNKVERGVNVPDAADNRYEADDPITCLKYSKKNAPKGFAFSKASRFD